MTDQVKSKKYYDVEEQASEIYLRSLFLMIWRTRYFVGIAIFLSGLVLAVFLALGRGGIPSQQIFHQTISLTFQGVRNGKYPNGIPFSINDILAPDVLHRVYEKNHMSEQHLTYKDFVSSLSIHPYSPLYESVLLRYRKMLDDKKLKFVERQQIEKEMREELSKLQRKGAIIQFIVKKNIGIPESLGKKLLYDIVDTWSSYSIESLGVLRLPEGFESNELVNLNKLVQMEVGSAIYIIVESAGKIADYINKLEKFSSGRTIIDKKSGHTLSSLNRVIENFHIFPNGIALKKELLNKYYTRHIEIQKLRKQTLANMAKALKTGIDSYTTEGQGRQTGRVSPESVSSSQSVQQNSSVMQIDNSFIDKIISLAQQSVDQKYRTKLLKRYINLKNQSIRIEENIKKLDLLLSFLDIQGKINNESVSSDKGISTKEALRLSGKELNELWGILKNMFDQLSLTRVSYDKHLYHFLAMPSLQTYHPILNRGTAIIVFSLLFVIFVLSMIAGLIWQVFKRNEKVCVFEGGECDLK